MRGVNEMNVDLKQPLEELAQTIEESKEITALQTKAVEDFYSTVTEFFGFWAQIAMNARASHDLNYKNLILENIAHSMYGSAQDLKKSLKSPLEPSNILDDDIRPRNEVLHHSSL